jgi:NADPH-dependent F420 reductase
MNDIIDPGIIAILGGTGKEGKGLAYQWAKRGHSIIIGSRSLEKAQQAANQVNQKLEPFTSKRVLGMDNGQAAERCAIAVMTVPFSAHTAMVESLKGSLEGKVLIDVTVPLVPPKVTKVQLPPAGSAALETRQILGEAVQIASAFQNISYDNLWNDQNTDCDVLVTGTSKETRELVVRLVKDAGLYGWDAGPLENSVVAEGLTSILIGINKQYGAVGAGIRITGVNR